MEENSIVISIIVPIYNVEQYLDRCLESIVNQSYTKIEIILVNDGSTDGSLIKCENWQKKDKRIHLINQENQGLGSARGTGISAASGEFLAFIDSDDWVHKDFALHLAEAAKKQKADIVYFDIYKAYDQSEGLGYQLQEIHFTQYSKSPFCADDFPEVLYKAGNWTWNKMYKKSLWQDLNIIQPAQTVEDICTIFVLLAKAKKIYHLEKSLYYYYQRENSLSYSETFFEAYKKSIEVAETNFRFYQIDKKYLFYIGKIFGECISFVKLHFRNKTVMAKNISFMEHYFQNSLFYTDKIGRITGIAFGSFNLRSVVKEALYYLPLYYGFSSIISMMDSPKYLFSLEVRVNDLRRASLEAEFTGECRRLIETTNSGFLFLDFMEERYDIIKLSQGGYLTLSEGFQEARVLVPEDSVIIRYGTEEFFQLWKDNCLKLIQILKKNFKPEAVILFRHRLSECYLDKEKKRSFNDLSVNRLNDTINELETYFINHFPGIQILSVENKELYYTDKNFTFGCYPWHLNNDYYLEAGRQLRKSLEKAKEHVTGFSGV